MRHQYLSTTNTAIGEAPVFVHYEYSHRWGTSVCPLRIGGNSEHIFLEARYTIHRQLPKLEKIFFKKLFSAFELLKIIITGVKDFFKIYFFIFLGLPAHCFCSVHRVCYSWEVCQPCLNMKHFKNTAVVESSSQMETTPSSCFLLDTYWTGSR